ncbi:uncharacterized protein [Dermacentor andersoni]|uniref:uncharacterized protein n=1 Tax=Dermacentor andersoni TaxID=34620 RepID=UPI00215580B3|nr:zinc finger protein 782-like [Dermacentor andersoni]
MVLPSSTAPRSRLVYLMEEAGTSDPNAINYMAIRRARDRERKRLARQNSPALRAVEAAARRRKREDSSVRTAEAEARRLRRQDPVFRAAEAEARRRKRQVKAPIEAEAATKAFTKHSLDNHFGYNCSGGKDCLTDYSGLRSVTEGSTTVMQGDAATQCDMGANVADKSTWCKGLLKSTQADVLPPKVSRGTQSEDLEDCHDSSMSSEAVSLASSNSRRTSSGMQEDAECDCRLGVAIDTTCSEEGGSSPTANAGSAVVAYACGLCALKFQELDALTNHIRTCPWPEPFQCGLCSQTCADLSATRDHLLASHINAATAECPFCGYTYDGRRSNIMRHMQRQHVPIKPFMCNFCKLTFVLKYDLLLHILRSHTKTHECAWCPSSFTNKQDLQVHFRQHISV